MSRLADVDPEAGDRCSEGILRASGPAALFVQTAMSRNLLPSARSSTSTIAKFGRLDILVNNAGLQLRRACSGISRKTVGIYLLARHPHRHISLLEIRAAAHDASESGDAVVNIASLHAKVASPFKAAYIAAKHGVLGLTKGRRSRSRRARHHLQTRSALPTCARRSSKNKSASKPAAMASLGMMSSGKSCLSPQRFAGCSIQRKLRP